MPEADSNLTGSQRAAVFLLSLGEESAAKVLKYLEGKEIKKVIFVKKRILNIVIGK